MKYQFLFLYYIFISVSICLAVSCKKPPQENIEPPEPKPVPTSVIDIDSNEYAVTQFGNTLWMAENLRVTRYDTEALRSGDTIAEAKDNQAIDVEKPYYKDGRNFIESPQTDNLTGEIRNSIGYLYNWSAAAGTVTNSSTVRDSIQGICPNGWRLPRSKDWDSLFYYLGGISVSGEKLKAKHGWYTASGSGSNASGMNCYPAGLAGGNFISFMGQQTMYWGTETHIIFNARAQVLRLFYSQDEAALLYINKIQANSVRCVKDL